MKKPPCCFFCGGSLRKAKTQNEFSCPSCQAFFLAQMDKAGCIIGLSVRDCGTPECCRHPSRRS